MPFFVPPPILLGAALAQGTFGGDAQRVAFGIERLQAAVDGLRCYCP